MIETNGWNPSTKFSKQTKTFASLIYSSTYLRRYEIKSLIYNYMHNFNCVRHFCKACIKTYHFSSLNWNKSLNFMNANCRVDSAEQPVAKRLMTRAQRNVLPHLSVFNSFQATAFSRKKISLVLRYHSKQKDTSKCGDDKFRTSVKLRCWLRQITRKVLFSNYK